MNVKVKIPESLEDITIGQMQSILELSKNEEIEGDKLDDEILKVVLNLNEVDLIAKKDRNILLNDIEKAIQNKGNFHQTFELKGIRFGLIPNFDNITNAVYTDLINYSREEEDLNRFMAVCYRPITTKDWFKNYKIEEYNGTSKWAEFMKDMPMSIANGCKGFFLNLLNDLNSHILKSMEVEQAKA